MPYKLYQPYTQNKKYRFRYYPAGSKPKNYVHGLERLRRVVNTTRNVFENESEEAREVWLKKNSRFVLHKNYEEHGEKLKVAKLILCTGGSDGLNVACLGYDVCWLNSESADLPFDVFTELRQLAATIYILFDGDATGQAQAHKLGMQYLSLRHIILPAKELSEQLDWKGAPCKDVRDYLNHYTAAQFHKLVEHAMPYQFWTWPNKKIQGSKLEVDSSLFYNFLNQNGIWKYSNETSRRGMDVLIWKHENLIKEIEAEDVHSFGNRFLEERNVTRQVKNLFHKTPWTERKQLMRNLKFTNPDFTQSSNRHQVMFFKNEAWIITAESIKAVKHSEAGCSAWEEDIYQHKVELIDKNPFYEITKEAYRELPEEPETAEAPIYKATNGHSMPDAIKQYSIKILDTLHFDYFKFLQNTSRIFWQIPDRSDLQIIEENWHLINRLYVLGYLCHTHKNPAKAWAVFATDHNIEDVRAAYGRSGKGTFLQVPTYFLRSERPNGRDKELTKNKHWNENITKWTRYLWMEDCAARFDYSAFYNLITGVSTVNPKNLRSVTIDFKHTPKVAFDSNYPLNNIDPSTKGRLLYTAFSDYYHEGTIDGKFSETRRPIDEFKHSFFYDWEGSLAHNWNLLANLVARCIQFYLQTGNDKLNPPMDTIVKNELTGSLLKNFDEWASEYFDDSHMNTPVVKSEALLHYTEKTKYQGNVNSWTRSLKHWCLLRNLEYNPIDVCNDKKHRRIKATTGIDKGKELIIIWDKKTEIKTEMKNEEQNIF